jgi:hypothetical protein
MFIVHYGSRVSTKAETWHELSHRLTKEMSKASPKTRRLRPTKEVSIMAWIEDSAEGLTYAAGSPIGALDLQSKATACEAVLETS